MRAAFLSVLVLLCVAGTAAADAVLHGHVFDLLGRPVPGARVHVMTGTEHKIVETDAAGYYRVDLTGDAEVSVVIGAGNLHTFRKGTVKEGSVRKLDLEVEIADGEIIRIIDSKPPTVPPKLSKDIPMITPPYSEEAVERDAWARAWLLLDIDEKGHVVRVKLLKRPGFDLDEIAVKEAMKLRFEPALDEHKKPMRTQMMWSMEWPSHGWLVEHNGTATRLPVEAYSINPLMRGFGGEGLPAAPPTGASPLSRVPCAGSGPLNLDLIYPVYRDCSRPNLERASELPWLDGTGPVLPDPPAMQISFRGKPVLVRRPNRIAQVSVTAGAAALAVGFAISYGKLDKYESQRAELERVPAEDFNYFEYNRVGARAERWRQLAILTGFTAAAGAAISAFVWINPPMKRLMVQPEQSGASVSFLSRF
ncbi:MAG TPA: carboxypeptidase regulatory-like domain-containing protein [Kofleriaceae bacterium]|nr:carboxypeptidase regulatory-like domain-containing protein [Kofleriaceae bacterium]